MRNALTHVKNNWYFYVPGLLIVLVLAYNTHGVYTMKPGTPAAVGDFVTKAEFKAATDRIEGLVTANVSKTVNSLEMQNKRLDDLAGKVTTTQTDATQAKAAATKAKTDADKALAAANKADDTANAAQTAASGLKSAVEGLSGIEKVRLEHRLREGWNQLVVIATWKNGQNDEVWSAKATIEEDAQKWFRALDVEGPSVPTADGLSNFRSALDKVMKPYYLSKGAVFNSSEIHVTLLKAQSGSSYRFCVGPEVTKETASTAQVVAVSATGTSSSTVR